MNGGSIPHQKNVPSDMAKEVLKELHDFPGTNGPGAELEIKIGFLTDSRDRRELGPAHSVGQHRCLTARSPRANSVRDEREPALVRKQQGRP